MKFLLLITFIIAPTYAHTGIEKNSIENLLAIILETTEASKRNMNSFRVDQCERIKTNLQDLLSGNNKFIIHYKFKNGCDIEGKIQPKIFQPFFVELKLRHPSYSYFEGQNTIRSDLQLNPTLDLEIRKALLRGQKSSVKFEVDYKFLPKILSGKYTLQPKGGEIRIFEINNKKVRIIKKITGRRL